MISLLPSIVFKYDNREYIFERKEKQNITTATTKTFFKRVHVLNYRSRLIHTESARVYMY